MKRLFDDHIRRKVTCLDGTWKFITDPQNVGEENGWANGLPSFTSTIIPSVWNTELGLLEYEGAVWYEKDFYFAGGTARLVFEAVMTECMVWLDGKYIGYHYGGFCQFDFIVSNLQVGIHKLVVKVDNRFDEKSIPQTVVDWYHYGGITRSVSVETLTGIVVTYGKCDYTLHEDLKSADVCFTAELFNAGDETSTTLEICLGGDIVYTKKVDICKGEQKTLITDIIKIDNIKLWGLDTPHLYEMAFYTDTDDLIDKIGFRSVQIKNNALLLNGVPLELHGVNRHEDHPDFGMAFPPLLMQRDLDIITDLGCNAVRGSHYPNARIFLDMLDERGILFWSEIPIWGCGFSEEALADEKVVERGLQMHKEMTRHYYNHPSVIFWGMHNEILSQTQPAYQMSKLYYEYLKANGGNRLVTYASDKPMADICFAFCDVIAVNQYFGWYYGSFDDWDKFVEEFCERRKTLGLEEKPVIISEFGAAAAYGHHTFDCVKWTEEYQAKLFSHALNLFHECPYIIGFYPWQFCDMRSAKDLAKAKMLNNKGLLNEYRKPKQAYHTVKDCYLKFKSNE